MQIQSRLTASTAHGLIYLGQLGLQLFLPSEVLGHLNLPRLGLSNEYLAESIRVIPNLATGDLFNHAVPPLLNIFLRLLSLCR